MKKIAFAIALFLVTASSNAVPRSHQASSQVASTPVIVDQRGTVQQPLIVKALQDEKSPEDYEAGTYERGEKRDLDRTTAKFTKIMGFATVAMLLVAVIQAGLFWYQLKMMRAALADAKHASDAAVDSAVAARESANTSKLSMVASERAYVHFQGMRWISHPGQQGVRWRLRPQWTNSGNTPTLQLRTWTYYDLRENALPDDFAFSVTEHQRLTSLAPAGVLSGAPHDVPGEIMMQVATGHRYLYVWGVATYRSVFPESPLYVTKFCVQACNLTGDPTQPWNDAAQFGIDWIFHQRHNCSDDDCQI